MLGLPGVGGCWYILRLGLPYAVREAASRKGERGCGGYGTRRVGRKGGRRGRCRREWRRR
eukprot:scaffold15137_cov129-Isochrysis_galbana.AAC.3